MGKSHHADVRGSRRQMIDCSTTFTMSVTFNGYEYAVPSSQLVQPRAINGISSGGCWGAIVAWQNGSVPESLGEIRLGTPFLNGVYSWVTISFA